MFALQPASKPNVQNNPLPDHSSSVNVVLGPGVQQVRDFRVPFEDIFDALVRAGYVLTSEVMSFGEIEKNVDKLIREGMIGMANEFGVVATISLVRIDWNEEFAMLIDEQVKLDPELIDMPHLEDASNDDLGIIIPNTFEVLVLASPQSYAYESDKMVP